MLQGFYELKPHEMTGIDPVQYARDNQIDLEQARKEVADSMRDWTSGVERVFINDTHMVYARKAGTDGWHLSIKRRDREPIFSWRELQDIKNALINPEVEALELYPAEERLVDRANQYHLWVHNFERINVGWDGKRWLQPVVKTEPSWRNDTYRVRIERLDGLFHLIIRRRDGKNIHDWRDLQHLKNEIIGIDHEGFEIFPAESRVISGPETHLWVYADMTYRIPVGFTERNVETRQIDASLKQRGIAEDRIVHLEV